MKTPFYYPLLSRIFVWLILSAGLALPVTGNVFNVTQTSDGTSESQLRGAIQAADALGGGPHIINVAAGTYNLTLGSIELGNRQQDISIIGAGPALTIINMTASNPGRIFFINPPGSVSNVTTNISGIKFTNGSSQDSFGGGAIISGGPANAISISNCVFENNHAGAFGGGALSNMAGGTISVDQCIFTNNTVVVPSDESDSGAGGAIRIAYYSAPTPVVGSAVITNCTFNNNSVSASHFASGGAVAISAVYGVTSTSYAITVEKNSFSNNSVAHASNGVMGGAISIASSFATDIHYNAFSGNTIDGSIREALSVEKQHSGAVSATNNWWGCNTDPQSAGTCSEGARLFGDFGDGTLVTQPQLVLKPAAGSTSLCYPAGASTSVTASFLQNSDNALMSAADLVRVIGLPVSFAAVNGTVSNAQTSIQANGTATASYTSAGAGDGSVNVLAGNLTASDATARVSISSGAAPGISSHPASLVQCSGAGSVTFSVGYSGDAPTTYKWFKGDQLLTDDAKYSGTNTATLTVHNPGTSDSGSEFKVELGNACGTVNSNVAILSVLSNRIYVASGASGDGSGWDSPMGTLSEALAAASNCTAGGEIWVKAGTYKPTAMPYGIISADPRNQAFYLINKVSIYGGFEGNETELSQRNPGTNQTILSGDIGNPGDASDNAYHVFVSVGNTSQARLDGFVIRDGNANLVATASMKGAEVLASTGGGAHLFSTSPEISNCVFTSNNALAGGGIFIQGQFSNPVIFNTVFTENTATNGAGFSTFQQTTANFVNCTIAKNTASTSGGAALCFAVSQTKIENSLIWGNTAPASPGVLDPDATISVRYSLIQGGFGVANDFNLDADPLFADASDPDGPDDKWMTADDGLKPSLCSPGIDIGRNGLVVSSLDILFNTRIHFEDVDAGAYEFTSNKEAAPIAGDDEAASVTVLLGSTSVFLSPDCQIIATIQPNGDVDVKGSVEAKVFVASDVIKVGGVAYVPRHYDILPASNPETSSARVKLFFTQSDFDAYNRALTGGKLPTGPTDGSGKGNLSIIQYHGTSSTGLPGSYSGEITTIKPETDDIVWNAAFSRWEISFNVVGFSGFFVVSENPLPVRLVSFHANAYENAVQLQWSIADAVGFSHFEIERSSDAKNFETIGTVIFNQNQDNYAFAEAQISSLNVAYYRLKMLDLDGSFAYSRLEVVHFNLSTVSPIGYPNPFHHELMIYSDKLQNALLINAAGNTVAESQLQKGTNRLETGGLVPGIYFLKTQNGDILKLIKE